MGEKPRFIVHAKLFKPSGKWYAEGDVEIHANSWDSIETILLAFWQRQKIVERRRNMEHKEETLQHYHQPYWTIVLDDHPASKADPNYHNCWQMVLQIGQEVG